MDDFLVHNCAFIGIASQLTLLRLDSCHVATVDVLEKVLFGMISCIKFSSMITIHYCHLGHHHSRWRHYHKKAAYENYA